MRHLCARLIDVILSPLGLAAAFILLAVRRTGVEKLPLCKKALLRAGVFPIRRHYYEPLFDTESLRADLAQERNLPGIDLNSKRQLALLARFDFARELLELSLKTDQPQSFYYHNPRFGPGDAELLYSMIRRFKPRRLIEIGSGFSTLVARLAMNRNTEEDHGYFCEHTCIEPFEEPWLEHCGATVLRQRVEVVDKSLFEKLAENDILFIDSSHVIRSGGDVLCEYLQILPILKPGVLVHVHDIFTPRDYPAVWVCDEVRFWNEQYLLEAFLCHNRTFEIVCALNFLKHSYPAEIAAAFPVLGKEMWREPGSIWLRRVLERSN